jgi:hypothetical protein
MNKIQDFLPATRPHKPYEPPPYVMPYLPLEAEKAIEYHEKHTRQPAFVLAFQRFPGQCPNCGGFGSVMVKFCEAGPFKTPKAPNVAVTYFEGNGMFPAGWYKIKETRSWICPECKGG